MEEWKEYKLGEVGRITTGKTPKTSHEEYFDGGIHFITPSDINSPYKHIEQTARTLTKSGIDSIKSNTIEKGSICVSCIGNIGYVGIATMNCTTNQQINSITVYNRFDRDFVYYVIKNLWRYFKNYEGQSTTLSILNKGQFSDIIIKAPSLETQIKIASILSSLDDKIEVNRRINENLEQQAQALFKSWFVDFEPFKDGEFVESELGKIPKGWRVGSLSELLEIKYGKDHKKLNDGNIPVYGSGGIMRKVDKFLYSGESVLIPRKGTLNNVLYVDESFWTVDTMFYTIPKLNNVAIFAYLYLLGKDLASLNAGSAVPSMTTEILNNMKIIIPPHDILCYYNSVVSSYFSKIKYNSDESRRLATLRDTLLPRLMSGEIKVGDLTL